MAAHVADQIGSDVPLYEAPLPVAALEAIVVPTADDGLQSQIGHRLQRGEVGTRDRRARLLVDLDRDIGGDVLGAWRAVVIDDEHVLEHLLDRVSATHRPGAAREGGVCEQGADPSEIPVVH